VIAVLPTDAFTLIFCALQGFLVIRMIHVPDLSWVVLYLG
jgi:hypothetical protein